MATPMRDPMRGLTAAGPSRVGVANAMRARDVSRDDVSEQGAPGEPEGPQVPGQAEAPGQPDEPGGPQVPGQADGATAVAP